MHALFHHSEACTSYEGSQLGDSGEGGNSPVNKSIMSGGTFCGRPVAQANGAASICQWLCENGGVYMYSGGHIASCGQQIMRTVDFGKHLVEAARRGNTLESGNLESFSFCKQV